MMLRPAYDFYRDKRSRLQNWQRGQMPRSEFSKGAIFTPAIDF